MQKLIAKDLLKIKAVFFRPEEPFTWASGIKSPVYCDNRLTLSAPEVRNDVENGLAKLIKENYPDAEVLEFVKQYPDNFKIVNDPVEAAKNADVLYTDVWASMGQESEAEMRKIAFKGYQINDDVMAVTNPGCMVLHCLPAHREEEITAEVFEAHAEEIFEEAENRLHAQKAVMVKLMGSCLED